MKSKYMNAVEVGSFDGHKRWEIQAKRGSVLLGHVSYFPRWNSYTFNPIGNTVFSTGCLTDLITFINQIGG